MDMPFREIIDLGHEMFHDMPNIGGAQVAFWPISSFTKLETISDGKLSMESRMMLMPEHCSTHLDVPRHCVQGATDVAGVPLERLVLPGHLLDLTHKGHGEAISISDLEEAVRKSGHSIAWNRAAGLDRHRSGLGKAGLHLGATLHPGRDGEVAGQSPDHPVRHRPDRHG